jgi:hypothetical protein
MSDKTDSKHEATMLAMRSRRCVGSRYSDSSFLCLCFLFTLEQVGVDSETVLLGNEHF